MSAILDGHLVSELTLPGAKFQILEYHWDAGAAILDCKHEVLLRWRIHPININALASVGSHDEVSFGRLMLHPPDVPTHARGLDVDETSRVLECRFDQQWLNTVTGVQVDWSDRKLTPCLDLRNGDVDHAVRRLTRELMEPGFASAALVEGLAMTTAADIMSYFVRGFEDVKEEKGRLSTGRLRDIHGYVHAFTDGCPTLSDVAKQSGISVPHLRRVFKSTTGATLHHFIEETRIDRAKAMLLDSQLSLKVIAYRLGFSHPSAFSFAFKKLVGEAPREYRHRCFTGRS
jgi:AraC family transcriptional regulator